MVFAMSLKLPVAQTVRLATTAVKLRMIQESVLFRNLVTHAMEGAFLTQMPDGICDQDEIIGCQDSTACNYDETATEAGYCDYADAGHDCAGACLNDADQDGLCDEEEVAGCTDSSACNYSSDATDDDASCTYAADGLDCSGACLVDSDGDGICDQDEVTGCQDCQCLQL